MEKVTLPIEKAHEPDEGARQPQCQTKIASNINKKNKFLVPEEAQPQPSSQNSSAYKVAMSQPAPTLSHLDRLKWLQKRRDTGLWVQCDDCGNWRFLAHVLDSHELSEKWYCRMNPDTTAADCSVPEEPLRVHDEEDLIHSEYSAGSMVWARSFGFPWWPAMVDDDPDTEQFYWLDGYSDIPTHYHVVFFDQDHPSRMWLTPKQLKPYTPNKKYEVQDRRYRVRIQAAIKQADEAEKLPLAERLAKYSFIATSPEAVRAPRQIKKKELIKFHNRLSKQYNIEFPIESGIDSDNEEVKKSKSKKDNQVKKRKVVLKRNNVYLVGTPKRRRQTGIKKNSNKQTQDSNTKLQDCEDVPANTGENGVSPIIGAAVELFKEPNSMAVQIGSGRTPDFEVSFDNDTSKTYVPNSDDSESVGVIKEDVRNISVRLASPSSDDFDF